MFKNMEDFFISVPGMIYKPQMVKLDSAFESNYLINISKKRIKLVFLDQCSSFVKIQQTVQVQGR